ncbi:hypothetical protein CCACVL1_17523 [Corchorus capsularis]|uniref:Uncharacterized protein n=1 Tax=Corchorus capsularis TaxID=210143 RepID=A0A1R3HRX2_COCAP|nr:hypothetical protein CCACVL1_17523 [Corchorus capsularis]
MEKRLKKEKIHNYEVSITILVTGIVFLTATSTIFLLKGFLRPCDPYKGPKAHKGLVTAEPLMKAQNTRRPKLCHRVICPKK